MTEIVIKIAAKTPEADPLEDRLEIHLRRCKLLRCQHVVLPHQDFCRDAHRKEFNRKYRDSGCPVRPDRLLQSSLCFEN